MLTIFEVPSDTTIVFDDVKEILDTLENLAIE